MVKCKNTTCYQYESNASGSAVQQSRKSKVNDALQEQYLVTVCKNIYPGSPNTQVEKAKQIAECLILLASKTCND